MGDCLLSFNCCKVKRYALPNHLKGYGEWDLEYGSNDEKEEQKMKWNLIVVLVLSMVVMAGTAMAANVNQTFNVTATVAASCRIVTTNDLAFGAYDPTAGSPLDVATTATYRCVKNTLATFYITPASGSRVMTAGAESLTYELYSDFARTAIFPSAFALGLTNTPASNAVQTLNIYGRIPALQDAGVSAAYTQTATLNIDF